MARPKSQIKRKAINTNIDEELIKLLKDINIDTGIPMNRLIEDALYEKYQKELKKKEV